MECLHFCCTFTFTRTSTWDNWLSINVLVLQPVTNFHSSSGLLMMKNSEIWLLQTLPCTGINVMLICGLNALLPSKEYQWRWPCSFCGSTFHFPENCPKCPFRAGKQPPKPPDIRRSQHPIWRDFNLSQCNRAASPFHVGKQPPKPPDIRKSQHTI